MKPATARSGTCGSRGKRRVTPRASSARRSCSATCTRGPTIRDAQPQAVCTETLCTGSFLHLATLREAGGLTADTWGALAAATLRSARCTSIVIKASCSAAAWRRPDTMAPAQHRRGGTSPHWAALRRHNAQRVGGRDHPHRPPLAIHNVHPARAARGAGQGGGAGCEGCRDGPYLLVSAAAAAPCTHVRKRPTQGSYPQPLGRPPTGAWHGQPALRRPGGRRCQATR